MPESPPPRPEGPPTDYVIAMQRQGLSNSQITQYLQREGFFPDQIFDAMNQASVKGSVEDMGADYFQQSTSPQQPHPGQMQGQPYSDPMHGMGTPEEDKSGEIERIAEAIIEEKWKELTRNINKIIDWKDKTESRIAQIDQEFGDMKKDFDSLHQAVLGKVTEYDQNIVHLGVEIKAMEKVFQKILPTLTENITELSQITKNMKERKA